MSDSLDSDREEQLGDSSSSSYPCCFFELYKIAEGSDVGLDFHDFADALLTIGRRFLAAGGNDHQPIQFYRNLHLKDLALAQACSRGSARAWERFLRLYRGQLYSAALAIAKNESVARELSDALSGDLFAGREANDGSRSSRLASYSGRGSLEGWLKAVLAHTYVDRYRSERRVVSLDQRLAAIGTACLSQPAAQDKTGQYGVEPERTAGLYTAIEEACLERTPEQRFLLASYFFDDWSLAEIARALGVHESTISRRMDRVLRELRSSIRRSLRKRGMSARQIEESLQTDVRELSFEVGGALLRGIRLARE